MAYCEVEDVTPMIGEIPLPAYISAESFMDNAADEIDTYIGRIYQTPVVVGTTDPSERPTRLLLKRLNQHLAAGRIILAVDASGENDNLHAYGRDLVGKVLEALNCIAEGEIALPGADPNDTDANSLAGPAIRNEDAVSQVNSFYEYMNVANYPPYLAWGYQGG